MASQRPLYQDYITVNPDVLVGKPLVKGTRIPVELVLKRLSQDLDVDALLVAYPRLTRESTRACLAYAQALVEGEDAYPAEPLQAAQAGS